VSGSDYKCPACRESMDLGMVYDRGHASSVNIAQWVKGPPEYGGFFVGLKTKGKETHTVVTYRCPRCGLLQQYALS